MKKLVEEEDKVNVLGIAVKKLLNRGVSFEREHRAGGIVHGLEMKQDLQRFTLIAKETTFEESEEAIFILAHRFLVLNSFNREIPIILALKSWRNPVIKFYAFDPWRIREEGDTIHKEGQFVYLSFPLRFGWRWILSKKIGELWKEMKKARRKNVKLTQFQVF